MNKKFKVNQIFPNGTKSHKANKVTFNLIDR